MPTPLASVVAGLLLLATLAQRGDAGWLSVLLGPSAAGSSARGIIAWTVLAPLAFAAAGAGRRAPGLLQPAFRFRTAGRGDVLRPHGAGDVECRARRTRAAARRRSARDAVQLAANRLRLAKSATGIQMWEWLPATREWISIDGAERLDPSTNEYLEAGLARTLRDGKAEFEFPLRRPGDRRASREERWMLATCWREQRERRSSDRRRHHRRHHRTQARGARARDQRDAPAAGGARPARLRLRLELRQRQDPAHLGHRADARLPGRRRSHR